MWPRGVTVSTLDSESSDRGSNPREAYAPARHGSSEVRPASTVHGPRINSMLAGRFEVCVTVLQAS